jgi:aldose 1-epimerase
MSPHRTCHSVEKQAFGVIDGRSVDLYVLSNRLGTVVKITTYGAAITAIETADRSGRIADIVLGFDDLAGYLNPRQPYFGATVGRVANRIARGRFTLNGENFQLAINDGPNHLHGGLKGFDKHVWSATQGASDEGCTVGFTHLSSAGEEGYPGNCSVTATYTLSDDSTLQIDYTITTDEDTPVNVTNHSYFNLTGSGKVNVLDHELMIHADHYTPLDAALIPTGEIRRVAGTPTDFRRPTAMGERIHEIGGYDHNYVVASDERALAPVARVYEAASGRILEVSSTEPGIQFYTGNYLDGTITGKLGAVYRPHAGFCLETQHFPDSMNHPNFPSTVLRAGDCYRSTTVYRFSVG